MNTGPTRTEIENAIIELVLAASGLPAGRVLLNAQGANTQLLSYIAVKISGLTPEGQAIREQFYDATRDPADQGIELRATVVGEFGVSLQAFGRNGQDLTKDAHAVSLLTAVQTALERASIRYNLNQAGLGLIDKGNVLDLTQAFGADFESRASLDLRFNVRQSDSEFTTWIQTVELVDDVTPQ